MVLVASHRHTVADLDAWRIAEAGDAVWCQTRAFRRKVERAEMALAAFVRAGPCFCGVSWGKDSVVVGHMAAELGVPLVYVRIEPAANPDAPRVKEAFLARQEAEYHELKIWAHSGSERDCDATKVFHRVLHDVGAIYGGRHVSGVRASESGARTLRMVRWGESSARTCAPIGWWSGQDVYAYLHRHGLPVHPAYACTHGGQLDRDRIRVASLDYERGRGMGREEWERAYYGDEIAEIRSRNPPKPLRFYESCK